MNKILSLIKGFSIFKFSSYYITVDNITDLSGAQLVKGQKMHVVGFANRKGYLTVDLGSNTMQVPHQLTEVWVSHQKYFYNFESYFL